MPKIVEKIGGTERNFDARPDRIDLRDRIYSPRLVSLPPQWPDAALIKKYFPLYAPLVLSQGKEGACTGFGLAAVVNYLVWRKALAVLLLQRQQSANGSKSQKKPTKQSSELADVVALAIPQASPRMLYELARVYDEWPGEDYEGSSCRGAMKGWNKHGVCSVDKWKYQPHFSSPKAGWASDAATCPLGAYYRVEKHSIADMQAALLETGALYVAAHVHQGWHQPFTDAGLPLLKRSTAMNDAGHAFALVGYTQDGFIIQNSWGKRWGYHGFGVMSYEDWAINGADAWVAALGAPMRVDAADTGARRKDSLAEYHKSTFIKPGRAGAEVVRETGLGSALPTAPWADDQAREHTVVLGNNGKPQRNHFTVADGEAGLARCAYELPLQWLKARPGTKRLMVYAHGGLNSEDDSIKRIRVLAPYFDANGIYPLFLTWKTGVMESITDMLGDAFSREPQTAGLVSGLLSDARDRAIEALARNVLVKAIWTEIKENAAAAAADSGGISLLAQHLRKLRVQIPGLEIHLAAHSAGSFPVGYLLRSFIAPALAVNSVTLFAPACTCGFANDHYQPAIANGVLAGPQVHVDLMTDAREQDDTVGPYGKSLLYLVSRALERVHKTPLIGLANAWGGALPQDLWAPEERQNAAIWAAFAKKSGIALQLHDEPMVADGPKHEIGIAHGSFDNDLGVITATLQRILGGTAPVLPVTDLRGF